MGVWEAGMGSADIMIMQREVYEYTVTQVMMEMIGVEGEIFGSERPRRYFEFRYGLTCINKMVHGPAI